MSKQVQFSEEAMREAEALGDQITQAFVNGLKKAKELGIEDMTSLEAEAFLKQKEEQEKKDQEKKDKEK